MPFEPLTITTSPARDVGEHRRLELGGARRIARRGAPAAACRRGVSSAARRRRPGRSPLRRPLPARARDAAPGPRAPSSSMSPSTAMRRPRGPGSAPAEHSQAPPASRPGWRCSSRRSAVTSPPGDGQPDAARRARTGASASASAERRERQVGAERLRRRRARASEFMRDVPPGRAEPVGQRLAEHRRLDDRHVGLRG